MVLAVICWSPCAQRRCYPTGRCAYRPPVTFSLSFSPPHMTCMYPFSHMTAVAATHTQTHCGRSRHANTPPRSHTKWREKRSCDLTSSSSASHDARSSIHFTTRGPCPSALTRGAWPSALDAPIESKQWASSIKSRFLVARSLFSRSTCTRRSRLPSSPAAPTTALPSSHSLSASALSSWARESPAPGECRGRCT
jgi:hypothetical protein